MLADHPKVFISYSRDADAHRQRVLALADRLRLEGIDVRLDQYEVSPSEGWPRWIADQLEKVDFVLVVCTATYERHFRGREEPVRSSDAPWEGAILTQHLYETGNINTAFIPIVFAKEKVEYIPKPLRSFTWYNPSTEEGYEALYRRLTDQPAIEKPWLGRIRVLPKRLRRQIAYTAPDDPQRSERTTSTHKALAGNGRLTLKPFSLLRAMMFISGLLAIWLLHNTYSESQALRQLNEREITIRSSEQGYLRATLSRSGSNSEFAHEVTLLSKINNLRHLEIRKLANVSDLSSLQTLSELEHLEIFNLSQVSDISELGKLDHLQHLGLWDLERVKRLTPIAGLSKLETLEIGSLGEVDDLSSLRELPRLRHLRLSSLHGIRNLAPLADLKHLEHLDIRFLFNIEDLSALQYLVNLRQLKIEYLSHVSDLSPLTELHNLEHLEVVALTEVEDLSALKGLANLRLLNLSFLSKVKDITPLRELDNLTNLTIWNLEEIRDLSELRGMARLRSLRLGELHVTLDAALVRSLYNIETLEIHPPVRLRTPEDLKDLPNFRKLILKGGRLLSADEVILFASWETGNLQSTSPSYSAPEMPVPAGPAGEGPRRGWSISVPKKPTETIVVLGDDANVEKLEWIM